jgi:hypothetical protein
MGVLIVMDHTGDSRYAFDPADAAAVKDAMGRFNELIGLGYTGAVRTGPGTLRKVTTFDPTATETMMKPRIVGG